MANIYQPSAGKIHFAGKVRALFESGIMLYPELSGRENAEVLCKIYFPELLNEHKDILEEALDFSELGEYVDAPIKTYSNGMLVRLTLSLLSSRPAEVLILDEVFDGADEFFREKLNQRVRNMIDNSGAVVFVSHYQTQVETICNRAILLVGGKIIFDGSLDKAFGQYRS
jgi:ABC-type polysaccharide/polyol phosphate transport system ATPase subunit